MRGLLIGSVSALSIAGAAAAQSGASHTFNIPAQDAVTALQSFAKQSGKQILFPYDAARGHRTPAVQGSMNDGRALSLLADGAGLEVASDDGAIVTLRVRAARPQAGGETGVAPSAVEELVVTANRRVQKVIDVPMSVTALSGQEIARQGIENVQDLSRVTPGLAVLDDGPGQTRIFIRGIANGNSLTSLVGVYLDEAPVTGAALGQLDLRLNDLQRVEVLRGPQGTLYGQGSAGGAVRYITNAPDLQQMSGRVDAQYYATEKGAGSAEVTGVLNLPVVKDVFALRITGDFADIGGWVDQPAAGRKDINDQNLRDVRVKARFQPNDRFRLDASALIHRNDGEGLVAGVDADGNVSFPLADPTTREHMVDNFDVYNATATYDFGPVTLLSSTSYLKAHKDVLGITVVLPPFGYEGVNHDLLDDRAFTQEVRLSSSAHGRFNWVLGAFYDDEKIDRLLTIEQYSNGFHFGTLPLPTSDGSKSWSVFGDASYELTPRLEVGGGVRYFHDNRSETAHVPVLRDTFTSVDPRVYASYELSPGVKLYANVAKGFRSGGFSGDTNMNRFGPESVWSYEAGIKGARGRLRWEMAGFYSVYQDIQTFVLDTQITGGLTNSGTAHIYGGEGLVAYDVTPQLTLQASGGATHGRFVSVLPTSLSNQVGDRVDDVPDYSLQLSAEYRFEWAAEVPGFARVDYNQIGPSTFTDHSAGVPSWVGFRSDVISLLNARLGVSHEHWSAELFGENLLDENGIQDPLAVAGFGTRPRPRVIGVKLGAAF